MFNLIIKKILPTFALLLALFSQVHGADVVDELYVDEVYATGTDKIEIIFSNQISANSVTEEGSTFRIEDVNNSENYYDVLSKELDELDNTIMILTLNKDLVDWSEYRVIVLMIEDIHGQNIKYGVDSEATFVYRYNSVWGGEQTTNPGDLDSTSSGTDVDVVGSGSDNQVDNTETIDNTQEPITCPEGYVLSGNDCNPIEMNAGDPTNENIGGTNVSADVENQVDVVADNNEKLPTAGPEHIFILILALVLGGGVFLYRFKRS